MSGRRVKYSFKTGENVLCFEPDSSKAKVLYDAKILDVSASTDKRGRRKPSYLIHFLGWNNSWDRVVPESFLLKNIDENRALMKKLETISQRLKSNKLRMKKIDSVLTRFFQRRSHAEKTSSSATSNKDDDSLDSKDEEDDGEEEEKEEEEEDENDSDVDISEAESLAVDTEDSTTQSSVAETSDGTDESEANDESVKHEPFCLDLPEALKRKLERDCYLIKKQKKHLKLPANPNVVTIVEGYLKWFAVNVLCSSPEKQRLQHQLRSQKQQTPDRSIQLCKEMVDGLRICFDFILPLCLLYESEMEQYKELTEKSTEQQRLTKTGKSASFADHHSSQKRHDDSDDTTSVFSELASKTSIKKEAEEHEVPSKRVTRNSTSRYKTQSNRSPTRSSVSKAGGAEKVEPGVEEHAKKSEQELRQCSSRTHFNMPSPDRRVESALFSHAFHGEGTPPRIQFESEPSEVSSHVSHLLSCPETRAAYLQKEKEVSNIFAWKLVPEELKNETPVPPSLVYGAHHLLRLFVRLPDILSRMEMSSSVQTQLTKHLEMFLEHLTAQCEELFPESSYIS